MSASQKIIIELDGGQHNTPVNLTKDKDRDTMLTNFGYTVIRIWNSDIFNNINGVLDYIQSVINDPTRKSKIFTLPQGEGIPSVQFELTTADKLTEKYDFVCANILHNVLAEIMGDLKNIMNDNAKMSLSGILDEKKPVVLDAIEREGLKIIDTISQDQWISFVVQK